MEVCAADRFKKWKTILFFAVLLIGILARGYRFADLPYGLNQDEASLAYDAYADITYGTDRNGDHNPIYAVGWGSGQNMGYNYLARPFIALFGLNAFSVRLPMLLCCVLSMIAFYLFARECFGTRVAFFAFFLLAVCPWHIMISRWALESNFVVPVLMFAAYFFSVAHRKKAGFILGMLFSALCVYAYSATIFFVALFVPAITLTFFLKKTVSGKTLLTGIFCFFLLVLPMLMFLAVNYLGLPSGKFLWFSVPLLDKTRTSATTIFSGGGTIFTRFVKNLIALAKLLITMDDGLITNAIPEIGAIYFFLIPFIVLGGIVILLRTKKEADKLIVPFLWLLCAFLQALVVVVNINRINILFPVLVLSAAVGIDWLSQKIKWLPSVAFVLSLAFFGAFAYNYFGPAYKQESQIAFFGGFDNAIVYAQAHSTGPVYLTNTVRASGMFALYALQLDPAEFLDSAQYVERDSNFSHVEQFGRFHTGIPEAPSAESGDAYIFRKDETLPEALSASDYEKTDLGQYFVIVIA